MVLLSSPPSHLAGPDSSASASEAAGFSLDRNALAVASAAVSAAVVEAAVVEAAALAARPSAVRYLPAVLPPSPAL